MGPNEEEYDYDDQFRDRDAYYEDDSDWDESDDPSYESEEEALVLGFADPGGESALRAATPSNPRNLPCPTCEEPNRLTRLDVSLGYQCNSCAEQDESGF